MKGTLALSWGPWGGFYVLRHRVCLGFVAVTLLPENEIDELMESYCDYGDAVEAIEAEIRRLREPSMASPVTRENRWRADRLERLIRKELPLDREGIEVPLYEGAA